MAVLKNSDGAIVDKGNSVIIIYVPEQIPA